MSAPNEPEIPEPCYKDCLPVYREALASGRTPELCEPGSIFAETYALCIECLHLYGDGSPSGTRDLISDLNSLLQYCEGLGPESTSSLPPSISSESISESAPSTTSAGPGESLNTSAASDLQDNPGGSNSAWIAGAVVGPLVGLAMIAIVAFLFIRRRRKRDTREDDGRQPSIYDKAQLHSDCLPAPKPDGPWEAGSQALHEMEGSYPQVGEMKTNEVAAEEMNANEVAAKEMAVPHEPRT